MWRPLDASVGTSAPPRLWRQHLELPLWSCSLPGAQRYIRWYMGSDGLARSEELLYSWTLLSEKWVN